MGRWDDGKEVMDVPSTCRQTGLEKGGGGFVSLAMRIIDSYN